MVSVECLVILDIPGGWYICMKTSMYEDVVIYIQYIFAGYNYLLDEVKGLATGFFPQEFVFEAITTSNSKRLEEVW